MKYADLISKMTLEEKCSLLSGGGQFVSKAVERLGIPAMWLSDGPHGLRKQAGASDHLGLNPSLPATCFPTAATMANSWDVQLGEELGKLLGEECRAQRVNVLLGPGLNMKRSPLCGRNFEYFSEDPYLAGKMAAAYIRGIQSQGVSACPKHYAVNSQETLRMHSDSVVDQRTLREVYLTAFEIAVKEGRPKSIMSAYNRVNGVFASEHKQLLHDILVEEWGFDGFTVTDWGGSNDGVAGLKAGTHLEMPTTGGDSDRAVAQAVREGKLSEKLLDERVDRYLTVLFDTVIDENAPQAFDVDAHHAFAQRAAAASIVLLKNEGRVLPLPQGCSVAIIGDFAETPRYQGSGSSMVNTTRLDNLKDALADSGLNVLGYAQGFDRLGKANPELLAQAEALAARAEVVLLCLGLTEIGESEGLDRPDMKLEANQVELLTRVAEVNANVVVVFSGGSPVETPWLDKCKALIHGYLGGQAGAGAMVDALVGKVNPSGKLAETWPMRYEDTPAYLRYPGKERTAEYREGPFIGYRYYQSAEVPVRFPFGYGLSYTSFAYSDLEADAKGVRLVVTNTGSVKGSEVVQLYVCKGDSALIGPKQQLKGFVKVELEPEQSKTVTIPLDDKAFRYWNTKTNRWEVEGGVYHLMVGASSADIRLDGEITVEGTNAPDPYAGLYLPTYRSAKVQEVPDSEFAALLGREIPPSQWDRSKPLEMNDTFAQLCYAKGWVGRLVYRITKKQLDEAEAKGKPDLDALFRYNMPFRAIAKMMGGMIDMAMAEALLEMFNGHFFKGFGHLIAAFVRKNGAEKRTRQALEQAGQGQN